MVCFQRDIKCRSGFKFQFRRFVIDQDAQHLQLLSIFHYVVGGILGLVGCFPILHLALGIAIVTGAIEDSNGPPPEVGWFFIGVAVFIILFSWTMAIAIVISGRKLVAGTGYTYCLVVAGIECLFMPLGTVLGVFTILVLLRPSVKALFGVEPSAGTVPRGGGGG